MTPLFLKVTLQFLLYLNIHIYGVPIRSARVNFIIKYDIIKNSTKGQEKSKGAHRADAD